jgi:hypothetical protein
MTSLPVPLAPEGSGVFAVGFLINHSELLRLAEVGTPSTKLGPPPGSPVHVWHLQAHNVQMAYTGQGLKAGGARNLRNLPSVRGGYAVLAGIERSQCEQTMTDVGNNRLREHNAYICCRICQLLPDSPTSPGAHSDYNTRSPWKSFQLVGSLALGLHTASHTNLFGT